jgi:NifU-like protein involved in Fe-S cluster formation
MKITADKSKELLETISADRVSQNLSGKTAQDALSIVIDAINSTVGGLIIADLNGIVRFANPSLLNE